MASSITLEHSGAYSLSRSVAVAARSAFVVELGNDRDGEAGLELAFALDDSWHAIAVRVTQSEHGLSAHVLANPSHVPHEQIRSEFERILCLDADGSAFAKIADRDPVVADLQGRLPGLRPVLFTSPYQAAARAIIGHRLPVTVAATIADRVAEQVGQPLDTDEGIVHSFPGPQALAELESVRGLSVRKVDQLRALGAAAADGRLSTAKLRTVGYDAARAALERLPGIGPFSSELVMLRGVGELDAFPRTELSFQRAMAAAYHLREDDVDAMESIAEQWRPYRSWVALLFRTAARENR